MDEAGEFGDSGSSRWGTTEMLVTAAIVLTAVSVGALIVYLARRGPHPLSGSPQAVELNPVPPSLEAKIDQIRAYLRTANKSESAAAGLSNASYALALLEDAEATFGHEALVRACDPVKLRKLIQKVQDRHGGRLAAA